MTEYEFYKKEYKEKLEPKLQEINKKYGGLFRFNLHSIELQYTNSNNTHYVRYFVLLDKLPGKVDSEAFRDDIHSLNGFILFRVGLNFLERGQTVLEYDTYFTEDEMAEATTNICKKIKNGIKLKKLFLKSKVRKWAESKKK